MNEGQAREPFRDEAEIEIEAAQWLGRKEDGLDEAGERELAAWLAADPRHASCLAELESVSRTLDPLALRRPARLARPDPDVPLRRPPPGRARRFAWVPAAVGLAAALAVAYVGWWRPFQWENYQRTAATAVGGLRKMSLPDDSVIQLNTDSVVAVAYSPSERRVELVRGEAYFSVAKDAERPFVVQVGEVSIRAVGTAFVIRRHAEAVEVIVTEGLVGVLNTRPVPSQSVPAPAEEAPLVSAGQRVLIAEQAPLPEAVPSPVEVAAVPPEDLVRRLAWQEKRLEFTPTPLRDVVAEFNRYSTQQLVVADEATGRLSVGGSFRSGDWQTLVRLLEASFGLEVERRGQEIWLRQTR